MKRIIKAASVFAAVAALASCAEIDSPVSGNTEVPGGKSDAVVHTEIVASFETTKVSYAEEGSSLRPSWEIGDEVIALGEDGADYKLTVMTVNEDKSAILSGEVPANCQLHLIYCPGITASELTVDYTAQTGVQETMPAVMLSDGEVKGGNGVFKFRNAGAIIGITGLTEQNGVSLEPIGDKFIGSTIEKVKIEGENLSVATIALSDDTLALTATEKEDDAISVTLSGITVKDANGTFSAPVFIAVPAGAKITKVSASVTKVPERQIIPSTAADKEGIEYVTIAGKKWAKWNVGASSEAEYGWYFHWAETNGFMLYAGNMFLHNVSSIEFLYSPSTAQIACASDYLYVKKLQICNNTIFNIPYHKGDKWNTGWTKYIHLSCYYLWSGEGQYDNKLILDSEDDAASVNWGGTWRMPTIEEYKAMKDATYWAWDVTDNGYYVFAPDASHEAGTRADSIPEDLNKSTALLFFRAGGSSNSPRIVGSQGGYYMSSSLNPYPSVQSLVLNFYEDSIMSDYCLDRTHIGLVRPVSD